jgi:hypothetical protein
MGSGWEFKVGPIRPIRCGILELAAAPAVFRGSDTGGYPTCRAPHREWISVT